MNENLTNRAHAGAQWKLFDAVYACGAVSVAAGEHWHLLVCACGGPEHSDIKAAVEEERQSRLSHMHPRSQHLMAGRHTRIAVDCVHDPCGAILARRGRDLPRGPEVREQPLQHGGGCVVMPKTRKWRTKGDGKRSLHQISHGDNAPD